MAEVEEEKEEVEEVEEVLGLFEVVVWRRIFNYPTLRLYKEL